MIFPQATTHFQPTSPENRRCCHGNKKIAIQQILHLWRGHRWQSCEHLLSQCELARRPRCHTSQSHTSGRHHRLIPAWRKNPRRPDREACRKTYEFLLRPIEKPHGAQARPLAKLDTPEEQAEAWGRAVEKAPTDNAGNPNPSWFQLGQVYFAFRTSFNPSASAITAAVGKLISHLPQTKRVIVSASIPVSHSKL